MSSSPDDRMYTDTHEWIMKSGNPAKMGITKYRATQLGTANAVDLPPKDASVSKDQHIGTITGAFATHTIISLSGGSVPDRNDILLDGFPAHPEYTTSDPFGTGSTGGWLIALKITGDDPRPSMMTAAQYDAKYPS